MVLTWLSVSDDRRAIERFGEDGRWSVIRTVTHSPREIVLSQARG